MLKKLFVPVKSRLATETISVVTIVAGEFWENTIPFLASSLLRQQFNLEKLEWVVVALPEVISRLRALYPDLNIKPVVLSERPNRAPSWLRREGYRHALGDIILFVDADIYLPAHILKYVETILRLEPNLLIGGIDRLPLTLDGLQDDPKTVFTKLVKSEYDLNSDDEWQIISTLYPLHPGNSHLASFIFGIRREHIKEEDFCQAFNGPWGGEDKDLALIWYKRDIHPVAHPRLTVWHWEHDTPNKELYAAQLRLLFARHGNIIHYQREGRVAISPETAVSNHPVTSSPYQLYLHTPYYQLLDSTSVYMASYAAALEVLSYIEGTPKPVWVSTNPVSAGLPHADIIRRLQKNQSLLPTAKPVHLWGLQNGWPAVRPRGDGYQVGFLPLDGELVDPSYLTSLTVYDELWVPQERSKNILIQNGWDKPVTVIPHGVFSELLFPHNFRLPSRPNFLFLTVGTGPRKNNQKLIALFAQVFDPSESVELWILDWRKEKELKKYLSTFYPQANVKVLAPVKNYSHLNRLYNQADAFISLSMGEGWNIPVIEAAACGVPVISVADNGVDYLNEDNSLLIKSQKMRSNSVYGFCKPDWDEAAQVLRQAVTKPQSLLPLGDKLFHQVHTQLNNYQAARMINQRLYEIVS